MKTSFPIQLETQEGIPCAITGKNTIGHPVFLAGKMRRPDSLSWHAKSDGKEFVYITGLWRGRPRYGNCTVRIRDLLAAFVAGGFIDDANSFLNAVRAWGCPDTAPICETL